MNRKLTVLSGLLMIIMGGVMLLPFVMDTDFSISIYWPLFLGLSGLAILVLYAFSSTKLSGIMFVGFLMLLLCGVFLFSTLYGWHVWNLIAPAPLFAVALALYLTYLLNAKHRKVYMVLAFVTGAVALTVFIILGIVFNETIYLAVALIISGLLTPLYIIVERRRSKISENN